MPAITQTYLGDGLYAEFDGFQLCLFASNGEARTNEVYLDNHVWASLLEFVKRLDVPAFPSERKE